MIECKVYNLAELKNALYISKRQWEEHKEELLDWLKLYFDYEIQVKGHTYQFNIKEQYNEYKAMPRKNKAPEMIAFYGTEVDHIL